MVCRGCRDVTAELRGHVAKNAHGMRIGCGSRRMPPVASSNVDVFAFRDGVLCMARKPGAPISAAGPVFLLPKAADPPSDRVNGAPGVVLKQAHGGARRDGDLFSAMWTCPVGRIGGSQINVGATLTSRHAAISPQCLGDAGPSAGFTNQSLTKTPRTGNFLNAFWAILMASRSWSSSSLSTFLVTFGPVGQLVGGAINHINSRPAF